MHYTPATPTLWLCETLTGQLAQVDAWRSWTKTGTAEEAESRIVWFGNRRSSDENHDDATVFPLARLEQGDTATRALPAAFARQPYLTAIAINLVFEAEPQRDLDADAEHAAFVERTEGVLYGLLVGAECSCARSFSVTSVEMSEPHRPPSEADDEKVWRVAYTLRCEGYFRA